jgi:hypothetical protein
MGCFVTLVAAALASFFGLGEETTFEPISGVEIEIEERDGTQTDWKTGQRVSVGEEVDSEGGCE